MSVKNDHGYFPLVVSTSLSFLHSRLITWFLIRLTQRVPLVEQELLTLPEHLSSPPVFSGVRATRCLVLYVYFVDRCLSWCTFSFGHCVVCSPSIYGFWLPLWYLKTLLGRVVLSVIKIFITSNSHNNHCHGRGRIVVGLTTTCAIMTITTNVVSSNHAHGEVHSIQHYVIKCISDLRQIGGFLCVLQFPPPIKLIAMI
jgi:hypothetical protein